MRNVRNRARARAKKTSIVGWPFGRNAANTAPKAKFVRSAIVMFLENQAVEVVTPAISSRPAVIGMSCHRVIPMAPRSGVAIIKKETRPDVGAGNTALHHTRREYARIITSTSVATAG